jgi:hypothetical protein
MRRVRCIGGMSFRNALALVLLVAAPSAAAAAPPDRLAVRPNGPNGPLVLYDAKTVRPTLRLPDGIRSANGRSFVAARTVGTRTVLTRYALPSGRVVRRGSVAGAYTLAALAADGTRVVLSDARPADESTQFTIVGTSRWRVQRRVLLSGAYGVEALSPDGRRLFLIRYGNGGYNLRVYDLRTRRLTFTPLVEGASGFTKMVGAAWTSIATRDGRWLLTLYIKPNGSGFIHALDLAKGFGHCLDLPAGFTDATTIRTASLVLSPDERRLYVAGPRAGRLLVLDLVGPRLARTIRFQVAGRPLARDIVGTAAVSLDERTVAFAVDGRLWRYRAAVGAVGAPIPVGRVAGLGFSSDGRRIVVVRRHAPALVLDAATGTRVR